MVCYDDLQGVLVQIEIIPTDVAKLFTHLFVSDVRPVFQRGQDIFQQTRNQHRFNAFLFKSLYQYLLEIHDVLALYRFPTDTRLLPVFTVKSQNQGNPDPA
jgi:hypothetical protein